MTKRIVANNPELTPWFPPEVKPVHVGWYHTGVGDLCPVDAPEDESMNNWWWDGVNWLTFPDCDPVILQKRYWRGLAVKAVQP